MSSSITFESPSLLLDLTPEEILEYWSLLTAAQRADLIERRTTAELEGLPTAASATLRSRHTVFDRFSGVYHAFGCLQRYVEEALADHGGTDRVIRTGKA